MTAAHSTYEEATPDLSPALRSAIADAVEAGVRRALTSAPRSHLLTTREVADRLGVSARTLQRIVSGGGLRPVKVGGQNRFHPDTVDAYVRSQVKRSRGGVR